MAFGWVAVTLVGSAAQTARNIAQSGLTARLGTLGATQVRFLFGWPFAVLFLTVAALAHGRLPPLPGAGTVGLSALGGIAQIAATALMLATMARRSFAVTTAWIKTEPVMIALGGALVLGEHLGALQVAGIVIATAGVMLTARGGGATGLLAGAGPVAAGLLAAALFGVSALAFRAAVLSLGAEDFILRAITVLVLTLSIQSALLAGWLRLFRPGTMRASLATWRGSLAAGVLGASSSGLLLIAFALAPAALVRTLALVEVLMAQGLGWALRGERPRAGQVAAMGVIVLGVGLLLAGQVTPISPAAAGS